MPFKSKAQWRFAFANKKPWAKKWAHETTGTKKAGTKRGSKAFAKLPKTAKQNRKNKRRRK